MIPSCGYFSFILIFVLACQANAGNLSSSSSSKLAKLEDCDTDKKVLLSKQLECFADYLVMVKGAKTEIFAEKIKKNWRKSGWRIRRAVVHQQELEELTVNERDMAEAEEMGMENAENYFKKAAVKSNVQGIASPKHRKISDLFALSSNGRLEVSDGLRGKLEKQCDCLAKFLARNFGMEHLQVEKIRRNKETAENHTILLVNRMKWHWENDESVRWRWARDDGQAMPEIRFEEGTTQYAELLECFEMLPIKDSSHKDKIHGKSFVKLNPMLARFRDDQLFVNAMPKTNKTFTIGHLAVLKKDEECFCLEHFEVGESVQQMYPCKHVFHEQCIARWLKINNTCPNCRSSRVIKP